MDLHEREIILREIRRWQAEGVLSADTCQVLLDHYAEPPATAAPPETDEDLERQRPLANDVPNARRTSFSQILLSETAVNTALYLGGFFIIVAAFIIAALVASARLPILIAATLIFLGGSLFTLRRLPQVSLVLFLIGSVLIPIDAQVISGMLDFSGQAIYGYWAIVTLLAALIWAGGFGLFRNWIFSSLAFLAAVAAVYLTLRWFDPGEGWTILALSLTMLGAVLLAARLGAHLGKSLTLPLLILSQIGEAFIIGWLLFSLILGRNSPTDWILEAAAWLLAALYYALSDWVVRRRYVWSPFPLAVAVCLGVFPLFLLGASFPDPDQVAWLAFGWGILLSLAAEMFYRREDGMEKFYGYAFFITGGLLFAGAVVTQVILEDFLPGEVFLLGFGLLYLLLHLRQVRWWLWTPALLAFSLAYFNLFLSGPFANTAISPGAIFLFPALFFLSLDVLIYKGVLFPSKKPTASQSRQAEFLVPVLLFAGLAYLIDLLILLSNKGEAWPAQIFLVYAVFFAVYAILRSQPVVGLLSTGSLALALVYSLLYMKSERLLAPLLLLAVIYYLVGLGMAFLSRTHRWSEVVLWSGLGLGALAACFAPFEEDSFAILGAALIALFYAVEGWRRRSVWYGLPACLIFYLAYLTALRLLGVSQPQYYSIGAAVLGVLMHNIFLRSKNPIAAVITGILTILILLSTTFTQMVQTEELRYFLLLFIEALVLLGYGLVMRSRSLFFLPIVYLVLATIVVMTTVLSGVPTAMIIGCTGLLLLCLGILALVMRDRLVKVSERVGERFNIW